MNKSFIYWMLLPLLLTGCTSWFKGHGQVIFHWERENTGIEKFSRDHSECMRIAEDFKMMPNFRSWFYSEEVKLNIRADWHSEKGIWASYIPYPGATPVLVNSLRKDDSSSPKKYRRCMEDKGYWHRTYELPTTSNIYIYRPQRVLQDLPFSDELY